jgi:hypothetical protein
LARINIVSKHPEENQAMRIIKQARMLLGLALLGTGGMAVADVQETVVVVGDAQTEMNCTEATPERARVLADKAFQDGAYQRAGECYLVAGQHNLADQAFVKASAQSKDDTSRRLASNLNDVKAQARQMKQAFQHR